MKKPLQNFNLFLAFLALGMNEIPKNLNIIIVGGTLSQYSHRNNLWTILAHNSHCDTESSRIAHSTSSAQISKNTQNQEKWKTYV